VNLSFAPFAHHANPTHFYYRKILLVLDLPAQSEFHLSRKSAKIRFTLEIQDSNALFGF
jgi:hypothetical protein